MRKIDTGDLWWKNAIFYCADVETFLREITAEST